MVMMDVYAFTIVSTAISYVLALVVSIIAYYELKSSIRTGYTHYIMGLIYAITIIVTVNTSVAFLYLAKTLDATSMLMVVIMAVGMAVPNSYYLSKVQVSAQGITEQTQKA